MKRSITRRAASTLALLAVTVTTALCLPAPAAHAAAKDIHKYVQLQVANTTAADLNIAFAASSDDARGATSPHAAGGVPSLPSATVAVAAGRSTAAYGIDLAGELEVFPPVYFYEYKNYFNVQVSPPTNSSATQFTLTHDGVVNDDKSAANVPVTLATSAGASYTARLDNVGSPDSGYTQKYRLVVGTNADLEPTRINPPVAAERTFIAGDAAGRHGMSDKRCGVEYPDGQLPPGAPTPCLPVTLAPEVDHRLRCSVISNDPDEMAATGTTRWGLTVNGIRHEINGPTTGDIWARTDQAGKFRFDTGGLSVQCSAAARTVSYDATRLTGPGTTNPVYKITVDGYQQKFTTLPSELQVDTYTVRGRTGPGGYGAWQDIGTLVPVGSPQIDHIAKVITYPPATFYFENVADGTQYHALSVSNAHGAGAVTELAQVSAPSSDLDHKSITSMTLTASTGLPVVANGVAQEQLKLKLTASGRVVNPDDRPELSRLYDYVYYRDPAGNLITGLYRSAAAGGYTSVSTIKGGYVNELGTAATQADPARVYLSTTEKTAPRVTAHLDVTKQQKSAEARVERLAANDSASGTARSGITAAGGVLDAADGAYHHYNGDRAAAALLTRYEAMPTLSSLPVRTPYFGHFMTSNGGAMAHLNTTDGLDGVAHLRSQLVNLHGTYVTLPSLAAG